MAEPTISIIVPVYKTEAYLEKCVASILAQTFRDFELLLIDDGSPDNCPALCEEAAARDPRIRVIHQKNAGLSAARNTGVEAARGEWIGFVDSDDSIAPEMYETLLTYARRDRGLRLPAGDGSRRTASVVVSSGGRQGARPCGGAGTDEPGPLQSGMEPAVPTGAL